MNTHSWSSIDGSAVSSNPGNGGNMFEIAVLHHRYKHMGGAERVADKLAETLDADLYTLYITPECADQTSATPLYQSEYMDGLTGRVRQRLAVENITRPLDVQHVDLDEYDLVITSGDYAHCYLPADEQVHWHYLHTPNRDLYNPTEFRGLAGGSARILKTVYFEWLRMQDQIHAQHVDRWICNSPFVADRCRRYYDAMDTDIRVISPPIDWENLGPALEEPAREDYWLTVGRLVPAKRIDILVDAFVELSDERLFIAGSGGQQEELEAQAPQNVEFLGYVSTERKRQLLREAKGFLFMGERECFGMSVAEALAAGTPVIAAGSGNMPSLVDDSNGELVDATPDAVVRAIQDVDQARWDYDAIREEAEQFSVIQFEQAVREEVMDAA